MTPLEDVVSHLIKDRKNERAIAILEKNPELFELNNRSIYSFLHYCAVYGNVNMVHYLLDNGCNINIRDSVGKTPLMLAVQTGQYRVAELLLSKGADFDTILCGSGKSALHTTFAKLFVPATFLIQLLTKLQNKLTTSEETAQKLMEAGCQLYQAVCSKNYKIIEYMLNHELSVHFVQSRDRLTALHFAVYYEDLKIVDLLLERGASISALDIEGRTPLFYLYYRNPKHSIEKLKILKLMLDSGKLIMLRKSTCAIFQIANILMRGNHEAVRLVLQSYPDFKDEERRSKKTMLHHLARNKNSGVVEELDRHIEKFHVNAIDKRRRSPLYWAIKARNILMVQYLLGKDATVTRIKSNLKADRLMKLLEDDKNADTFFLGRNTRRKVKTFDITPAVETKKNNWKKIKFIIGHLAMLKQLGKRIKKDVWLKIKSTPQLKRYFEDCQRVLQMKVCGQITILRLLTDDEKNVASYLNQMELHLKLERVSYSRRLKSYFPYYFNVIRERIFVGRFRKTLKDNLTPAFCKIPANRLTANNLISGQIMDYLNNRDLLVLYRAFP